MGRIRLFGIYVPLFFLLLAGAEVLLLFGSVFLAALLRFDNNLAGVYHALGPGAYRAVILCLSLILSLAAVGLYQTHFREGLTGQLLRILVGFLLGWLILAFLYYLVPTLYIGRGVSVLSSVIAIAAILLFRPLFFRLVDAETLKPRVLVYGAGEKATWISRRMNRRSERCGFRLLGFVDVGGSRQVTDDPRVFRLEEPLSSYVRRQRVDQIIVAVDDRRNSLPMEELLRCRLEGVQIFDLPTFFERETGTVALELTDPSWLIFNRGFRHNAVVGGLKRGLDLLISSAVLIASSPLVVLTIVAIKIEDGWRAPILYSQMRVGEKGRIFRLYKLRSMRVDAEQQTGACWARAHDDRVTQVGSIIRKLRIDELPQVLNVFRGEMSFVGPRPERPEFTRELEQRIRYYRERCAVKPGVTGWAQLRYPYGASDSDSREKLKYDLFYIKNHNMLFDLMILLWTVEVVIFGKGAR